jgi:hypothetical protein
VVFDNQDAHGGRREAPRSADAPRGLKACLTAGYSRITAFDPPLSPAERYPWVESFPKTSKGVIEMEASKEKAPSARAGRGRARLARPAVLALALAASLGLAVLASGCGGSPGPGVAKAPNSGSSNSGSTGGSSTGDPAAYSACMRKHGVPNFPDPDSKGRIRITSGLGRNGQKTGVDVNSPQFKKAQQACQKLQPNGGRPNAQQQAREQQAMLKFSRCMRSHGVPKFPDPKFTPNGGSQMTIGKEVDPNSPQFKAAQKACQKLVPNGPLSAGPGDGQ